MPKWLRQRALLSPDREAVVCGDERLTFAELDEQVAAAARRLTSAGVEHGQAVALLSQNSAAFVVAAHAVGRAGAVLVPLNTRLASAELAWQLENTTPAALMYDDSNAERAGGLVEQVPGTRGLALSHVVALSDEPGDGLTQAEDGQIDLSMVHSIVHTSGTTGRPKGAMLTYGNHLWSAVGSALNLGLREDDRWLACLPLFHVGGLAILMRSVIYSIPAVVHESFDPAAVNRTINDGDATIVSVVSAMLQRMLEEQGLREYPPTLRCVLVGGGPVPQRLLEECAERHVPVVQTYGLTEAASQVATLAPEDALGKLGSAGKPLFPTQVRILADDGSLQPPHEAGEIAVRGPTVMAGYHNQPEATERAVRDGWLHTGDIGYLDDDGYLYVEDRRDDLIVSGGENVYPAEVEAVLASHPAVAQAGVIGLADDRWGQTVAAAVTLRDGERVRPEELQAFCRTLLAGYKVPSLVRIADDLPRDAAGKLVRHALRDGWPAKPA